MSGFLTRRSLLLCLLLFAIVAPLNSASAEGKEPYAWTGIYVQAGILAGFPNSHQGNVDFGPGIGMALSAGYRQNAYFAGEVDFSHVWRSHTTDFTKLNGNESGVTDDSKLLEDFEITFNLKGYPLGFFEEPPGPDWIQPYVRAGIGFGQTDVSTRTEVQFMLRVGGGVDLLIFDPFGIYVDGGYTFHTDTLNRNENPILDGQAQIRAGILYRF